MDVFKRFETSNHAYLPVYVVLNDYIEGEYSLFRELHVDELAFFSNSEYSHFLVGNLIFLFSDSNYDIIEKAIYKAWNCFHHNIVNA